MEHLYLDEIEDAEADRLGDVNDYGAALNCERCEVIKAALQILGVGIVLAGLAIVGAYFVIGMLGGV